VYARNNDKQVKKEELVSLPYVYYFVAGDSCIFIADSADGTAIGFGEFIDIMCLGPLVLYTLVIHAVSLLI